MRWTSRLKNTPLISVLDDDSVVRGAIESLLTSHGFMVCTFASAEAFLQSRVVAETSCLISDVQMPHTSGVELQDCLADLGFRIPTIFITAYPDDAVRARVLEAGAVCFLHKPFDGQSLIQCIHNALERKGRRTTAD
jgi:FixJ family two-component response regulator